VNSKTMLLLLIAVSMTACVRTSTVELGSPGQQQYSAVDPANVRVFVAASDVPGDFEKIAMINAEAASGWTNEKQMVEKLRKEAGKLGANGIILEGIQEPSAGAKIAGAVLGVAANRHGKVVAIRYDPNATKASK
jgi:hypothetical protein